MKIVPSMIVAASLVSVRAWRFFGLSYWLLGASLTPLSYARIPLFVFTLSASLIISLLTIFVPGGIGVRESIMVFILGAQFLPAPVAVIIAALSRVVVILSELLSALLIVFINRQPWKNYIKKYVMRK